MIVALLVLLLAPAALLAQAKETEQFHRSIPFAPGGTLRLDNFSGRVSITGSSSGEVTIDAVRRATRDRLARIKLEVEVSGNTVRIQANAKDETWEDRNDNVVETDFEIRVPSETNLDVKVFSSPVHIAGVQGKHHLKGFSGEMTLQNVSGPVDAETFSGKISMEVPDEHPDARVTTFSGAIDLRVSANARADVSLSTFSGTLDSDLPLTIHSQSRRSLRGSLNDGGGGQLTMHTFSGSVKVRR
jgi:DUF4097 and DUF4098 domain-containing protein YvlB